MSKSIAYPIVWFSKSGRQGLTMKREQLFLEIINNLRDGVYYVDTGRRIQFWNKAAEEITGYTSAEIVGKECHTTHLNHIDTEGCPLCSVGCPLFATIIDGNRHVDNVFVRHKSGYRIPITVNVFPIHEHGDVVGAVEVFTQNSPKAYEDNLIEELAGIAMHDKLTGLPNRRYLESFLEYKLSEYQRFGRLFALVFADIDNFGRFNNEYGHEAGDAVLCNIAASLKKSIGHADLVGRWGGEEFVGIYTVSKDYKATIVAEKLRQLVRNTEVIHKGEPLRVSISVGATVVRKEDTILSIVDRADQLMYESKQKGKDRVTAR